MNRKLMVFILITLITLGLTSCVTSKTTTTTDKDATHNLLPPSIMIWVLPPKVSFESVDNSNESLNDAFNPQDLSKQIQQIAMEEARRGGFHSKRFPNNNVAVQLQDSSNKLVRSSVQSNSFLEIVQKTCDETPNGSLLLHYLRVKVGQERSWKPVFGGTAVYLNPTVGMSSSYLRAVIRDCRNGRVLWNNELFARELANMDSATFMDSVRELYTSIRGGNR